AGRFLGKGTCIALGTTDPSFGSRTTTRGAVVGLDLRAPQAVTFQLGDESPKALVGVDYEGSGCDDGAVVSNSTVGGPPKPMLRVVSLHPSGIRWRAELGEAIWSSAATGDLSGEGRMDLVVGCNDGNVHCLSVEDGREIWTHRTTGMVWSSPAVGDL